MSRWDELAAEPAEELWELFHENCKTTRHDLPFDDTAVLQHMSLQSLTFPGAEIIPIPQGPFGLPCSLEEAIRARRSTRDFAPHDLTLHEVSALLQLSYGITASNEDNGYPRPFRSVPSGGALYPLEVFVQVFDSSELRAGLYHFNPVESWLTLVRTGDERMRFSKSVVQPELIRDGCAVVLLVAFFERTVFKYGSRGYRFACMEAGHIMQNIMLACAAQRLGCTPLAGFYEREVDALLGFDGLAQSTVYMVALGGLHGAREGE